MATQINFFTTPADIRELLQRVEQLAPVQYTEIGSFSSPKPETVYSWAGIQDLGIAAGEQTARCKGYLITEHGRDLKFRKTSDESHYFLDQLFNSKSVLITPGGWWNQVLLRGSVGTVWQDDYSIGLMKKFRTAFRKQGTKIKSFWVGREAEGLLRAGTRLTIAEQSPPQFDLAI